MTVGSLGIPAEITAEQIKAKYQWAICPDPRPDRATLAYFRISDDRKARDGAKGKSKGAGASTKEGFDGIERQVPKVIEMCAERDLDLVAIFIDNDVSISTNKRTVKPRPEYDDMIRRAEAGEAKTIAVYNLDRGFRSLFDFAAFTKWAKTHGIEFADTEYGDASTAGGRLGLNVRASVAQWEAERISERSRMEREQRRLRGVHFTANPPWGYLDSLCTQVDPVKAEALKHMAAMVLEGASRNQIIKWLHAEGIPTQAGGRWQHRVVTAILTNPVYAGFVTHNREIVGKGRHIVPIISEDTHEALMRALAPRAKLGGTARVHLLSGFVRCGRCGARMRAHHERWECPAPHFGGCGRMSRSLASVSTRVDEWMVRAIVKSAPGPVEIEPAADPLTEREAWLRAEMDRLRSDFSRPDRPIAPEDFYALLRGLRTELDELKAQRATQRRQRASERRPSAELLAMWQRDDLASLGVRRGIARQYIEAIMIEPLGKGHNKLTAEQKMAAIVIIPAQVETAREVAV